MIKWSVSFTSDFRFFRWSEEYDVDDDDDDVDDDDDDDNSDDEYIMTSCH